MNLPKQPLSYASPSYDANRQRVLTNGMRTLSFAERLRYERQRAARPYPYATAPPCCSAQLKWTGPIQGMDWKSYCQQQRNTVNSMRQRKRQQQ